MTAVETTHIRLDEQGRAWIDDTNVKVIEIAKDWLAHGSSPEEMCFQYPHLSLAQVHAALAHYCDHQEQFDRAIADELERSETQAMSLEKILQSAANCERWESFGERFPLLRRSCAEGDRRDAAIAGRGGPDRASRRDHAPDRPSTP